MKLLDRTIAELDRRLLILAPSDAEVPDSFQNQLPGRHVHAELLQDVQRLRGAVYLEDGAVEREQLTPLGLHVTPQDQRSWHIVFVNEEDQATACIWYLQHGDDVPFRDLRVPQCSLAEKPGWFDRLSDAVESNRCLARREGLRLAEVGGWAVARDNRCSSEGLLLALAAFSLANVLGGSIALTTATFRHSSAQMLRRLGGASLRTDAGESEVPAYFDSKYRCLMELLWFNSQRPNPRYLRLIRMLESKMTAVRTFVNTPAPVFAPALAARRYVEPAPLFAA